MRYRVSICETITYDVFVDADDENDAEVKANDKFIESADPYAEFSGEIRQRETENAEPADEADDDPKPRFTRYGNENGFVNILD